MTRDTRMVCRLALSLLLLTAAFGAAARPARADVVQTFALSNVTFSDGSVAEGTFTYDFTTQTLVSVRVTAGNAVYDNSAAAPVSVSAGDFYGAYDSSTESDTFQFVLDAPLTPTTGSTITLDPAQSTETIDTTPGGDNGTVTTLAVVSGAVFPVSALPTTTALLAGKPGRNGWYTTPVTVTLKAAGARPVASTEYSLDGGSPQSYSGPFVVSPEAAHTLTFRSTDTGGNVESPKSVAVDVDGTPPVTSAYANGGPTLTYTASDNASGVAATLYTMDGGAVKTASGGAISVAAYGPHALRIWSVDVAGNVEASRSYQLDTPPSVPGTPVLVAQTVSSVTFTWAASHGTAGVAGYDLRRYFPGHSGRGGGPGAWATVGTTATNRITYSASFQGNVSFAVEAYDSTGNPSAQSAPTVVRGYSAPTIYPAAIYQGGVGPYAILGGGFGELVGMGATGFSPYAMTVAGYPAPTLAVVGGPKGMTVSSATGVVSWTPAGAPGTYTATIKATNVAGTASTTFTYVVYAAGTDLFAPTTPTAAPTFSNITRTGATVSWAASTDNVGVAGYEIDVYGSFTPSPLVIKSAGTALSVAVTGLPPGSSAYVRMYAYDAAGNYSAGSPYGLLTLTP